MTKTPTIFTKVTKTSIKGIMITGLSARNGKRAFSAILRLMRILKGSRSLTISRIESENIKIINGKASNIEGSKRNERLYRTMIGAKVAIVKITILCSLIIGA